MGIQSHKTSREPLNARELAKLAKLTGSSVESIQKMDLDPVQIRQNFKHVARGKVLGLPVAFGGACGGFGAAVGLLEMGVAEYGVLAQIAISVTGVAVGLGIFRSKGEQAKKAIRDDARRKRAQALKPKMKYIK